MPHQIAATDPIISGDETREYQPESSSKNGERQSTRLNSSLKNLIPENLDPWEKALIENTLILADNTSAKNYHSSITAINSLKFMLDQALKRKQIVRELDNSKVVININIDGRRTINARLEASQPPRRPNGQPIIDLQPLSTLKTAAKPGQKQEDN